MLNALRQWLAAQPASASADIVRSTVVEGEFLDGAVKLLHDPDVIFRRLDEINGCPDEMQLWTADGLIETRGCLMLPSTGERSLRLRLTLPVPPKPGQAINLAYARRGGLLLVGTRVVSSRNSPDQCTIELGLDWPETVLVHEMRQTPRLYPKEISSASWQAMLDLLGCPLGQNSCRFDRILN